jgi:multicomponent Na+:H+ antiporter subunit E
MKHGVVLAIAATGSWLLWSGHFEPLMLVWMVISVGLVVWAAHRLGTLDDEGVPLPILRPALLPYLGWLVSQVVLSNRDVVRRIWSRDPGLDPQTLVVDASQRSAAGRVLYANSITLTPGTVSVRMVDEHILVHALHQGTADDVRGGDMDRRVRALEGA